MCVCAQGVGQRGVWSQLKAKVKVKVGEERWGGCRGDGLHAGASELGSQS